MVAKHINISKHDHLTTSTVERVKWSDNLNSSLTNHVIAIQTTRYAPVQIPTLSLTKHYLTTEAVDHEQSSPYGLFNLGFHVGDKVQQVKNNRALLSQYINQQHSLKQSAVSSQNKRNVKVQWLEQVHGNDVVTITHITKKPLVADAAITREKNIALAIMTADCLPILLTNTNGEEVAAIHGGWRPLAANIITRTIESMQSEPSDITAWLGPCIGPKSFEVGHEVKEIFTQQNPLFETAFVKQKGGKYLANLHIIARLQLVSLGVTSISSLDECTYQQTGKYYSYRKDKVTGRMASIICRR